MEPRDLLNDIFKTDIDWTKLSDGEIVDLMNSLAENWLAVSVGIAKYKTQLAIKDYRKLASTIVEDKLNEATAKVVNKVEGQN